MGRALRESGNGLRPLSFFSRSAFRSPLLCEASGLSSECDFFGAVAQKSHSDENFPLSSRGYLGVIGVVAPIWSYDQ